MLLQNQVIKKKKEWSKDDVKNNSNNKGKNKRPCLKCGKLFPSEYIGRRICKRCTAENEQYHSSVEGHIAM